MVGCSLSQFAWIPPPALAGVVGVVYPAEDAIPSALGDELQDDAIVLPALRHGDKEQVLPLPAPP